MADDEETAYRGTDRVLADAADGARTGGEGAGPHFAVIALNRNGVVVGWNEGAERLVGYTAEEMVGRHFSALYPPEDIERGVPRRELMAAADEGKFEGEVFRIRKDGTRFRAGVIITALGGGEGTRAGYVKVIRPLEQGGMEEGPAGAVEGDEERIARLKRLYSVLSKTSEAIIRIHEPVELYEEACRIVVEDGLFRMAWVGLLDPETHDVKHVARWGHEEGYLDVIRCSALEIPEGLGPTGTAVREGEYRICEDFEKDERVLIWRDEALKRGFRSNAAFPLKVGSRVVGAFTLYAGEPRFFDEEQIRLLESLAGNISFAIESLDKEAKRQQAEEALRRSEEYFRSLIENAQDIITIINEDGTIRYSSPSTERVLGYKRSELRDKNIFDFIHEDDRQSKVELHTEVISNPGMTEKFEVRFKQKDGEFLTLEAVGRSYVDETGAAAVVINARDITERKIADEELRESESTARVLLNAPSDAAFLIDANGRILAANDMAARTLGRPIDELIGAMLDNLFTDDLVKARKARSEEVLLTGKAVRFEDERGGRHFDNSVYPIFDAQGKVYRLAVFTRDITEQKRAVEAQRKDRDFVSAVIDTTDALVLVVDREGRTIIFNNPCERTSGYTFDEVRGRPVWDILLVPEEVEQVESFFKKMIKGGAPGGFESHWITRHGNRRLISWSNSVLFDEGGAVEYIICTGIDTTERKKAEEALKESEEKYRAIFESTGTAMCLITGETTVSFMNQEFERMTGFGAEEVEGRKGFADFLLAEDVESFMSHHREVRRGKRMAPIHFECRMQDKRGNKLYVYANMGLLPGMDSSVMSLIDITREKNYEHDLQETAERLRDFLTVASHELRHPITIVKGYANTLTEYMDTMPRELIMEILDDIDVSSDRLTHYVEELMDVSRVEEGAFPVERREMDTGKLVQSALEDMRVMGVENKFEVRITDDAGALDVDPDKFVQLLVIILDNAVKFSSPQSPVDLEISRRDGEGLVSVLDRGIGISEEDREKVFDRFYQVEDVMHHSKPGIGLGLYIAREIVGAHGGKIWCEPREGGGSIFRFTIP